MKFKEWMKETTLTIINDERYKTLFENLNNWYANFNTLYNDVKIMDKKIMGWLFVNNTSIKKVKEITDLINSNNIEELGADNQIINYVGNINKDGDINIGFSGYGGEGTFQHNKTGEVVDNKNRTSSSKTNVLETILKLDKLDLYNIYQDLFLSFQNDFLQRIYSYD